MRGGFTLIELLIVMVIMGTVLSFGFANFRGFQQRQSIVAGGREIESLLVSVKADANAGKYAQLCQTEGYDFMYGMRFKIDGPTAPQPWETYVLCGDDGSSNPTKLDPPIEEGKLGSAYKVKHSQIEVDFLVSGGADTSGSPPWGTAGTGCADLGMSTGSPTTHVVCVTTQGIIYFDAKE